MGLPERLVERQLAKRSGDLRTRVRGLRRNRRLLLLAALIGLCNSVLNLWVFDKPAGAAWYWAVLGVLWLTVLYVVVRQHRHLGTYGTRDG